MADHSDLPFKAEYAKSGRASCKSCRSAIAKDTLRLAIMVQVCFHINKTTPEIEISLFDFDTHAK